MMSIMGGGGSKKKTNCNDTTYLLGSHMCNNFFQNESINLSNLNLTNEYSSLSPTHNNNQSNLNNSSLILKNNGLQKRIFRMNNVLASPSAKVDSIVNAIGCQTVKSSGIGNKSFNLKIKLKNESSLKKLKLSTQKKSDKIRVKNDGGASGTTEQKDMSAPREAYNSNNKNDHSAIETSNIIMDEKFSDLSFTSNFKDIIGSIDDKYDVDKMKQEL